jgi:NADH-quinone oxidoreductase subunit H
MMWFPVLLVANLLWVIVLFYGERKGAAFMQDRMGPNVVGKWGMLQAFADLLKLLQKEAITITGSDRLLFGIAPLLIFAVSFVGYVFIPLTPDVVPASGVYSAVFLLLGLVSLDVFGILMAGWGSNSKYPVYGAMRGLAQIISYEIPVGITVLCVVVLCQTLDLQAITYQQTHLANWWAHTHQQVWQGNYLFGIKALGISTDQIGGILTWNIFRMPLLFVGFVIYYIATLAECNRAPFDLPEGESELVGGFHTEYSGFKWAVFFLSEYTMQLLFAALGAVLFLGGWGTPLPNIGPLALADYTTGLPGTWTANAWGVFWLMIKVLLWGLSHIWVRWTFPRLRLDQLMYLCWQVLLPISMVLLVLCAVWRMFMV